MLFLLFRWVRFSMGSFCYPQAQPTLRALRGLKVHVATPA